MSSAKTIIYPNVTTNSLILKREREVSTFFRKKGRSENLPIGVKRPGHGGGGRGGGLIF
jgi:hypothetical protein